MCDHIHRLNLHWFQEMNLTTGVSSAMESSFLDIEIGRKGAADSNVNHRCLCRSVNIWTVTGKQKGQPV